MADTTTSSSPLVLVVGAGPVGLANAILLRQYGINVRIVDMKKAPADRTNEEKVMSKAVGVHSRTLELLHIAGAQEEFVKQGVIVRSAHRLEDNTRLLDFTVLNGVTEYPYILTLQQYYTEQIFLARLEKLGVKVEWEAHLEQITQDENEVRCCFAKGGEKFEIKATYVIAADGAHSTIRKLLDVKYVGDDNPQIFMLADVKLKWDGDDRVVLTGLTTHVSSESDKQWTFPMMFFPEPQDRVRIVTMWPLEEEHLLPKKQDLEFWQKLMDSRMPNKKITLYEPHWLTQFRTRQRLAEHYRKGRVFLAGDAAHCHSPVGGQGMNTGIQDAFNLTWKLAYVIKGLVSPKNAESLLTSYETERHMAGARVVNNTGGSTTGMASPWLSTFITIAQMATHAIPSIQRPVLYELTMLRTNYRGTDLVEQVHPSMFSAPMQATLHMFGFDIQAGDRVPHGEIVPLKCLKEGKMETIYSRLANHFGSWVLFLFASNSQEVEKIPAIVKNNSHKQIVIEVIAANEALATSLSEKIPDVSINVDKNLRQSLNATDRILLARPDATIGFLGGIQTEAQLHKYIEKVFGN